MTSPIVALLAVHQPAAASPSADATHSSLYETCVAVIIAVLVVLYFDERVRRDMSPRQRGSAIGWLGGILALGILTPVMALAGFISDTAGVRASTVLITFVFLVAAFGIAISAWGREDGRRIRAAQSPLPIPPVPPVPRPNAQLTERERAAEVLGYAFVAIAQFGTAYAAVSKDPLLPGERLRAQELLRAWTVRWAELAPALAAILVGYPSPQVRGQVETFTEAATRALAVTAKLVMSGEPLSEGEREQVSEDANREYKAIADAEKAIVVALHRDDSNGARSPARTRRARTAANSSSE